MPEKCMVCGSESFVKNGSKTNKTGRWQMYKCNECGHNQKGELQYTWKELHEAKKQVKEIEYFDPDKDKNRIGYQCGSESCNKTWMYKIDAVRCIMSGHRYNKLMRKV
ncbi:MAG: hypothetical protein V1769_07325 [Thermoplasmatota archaeon]